MERIFSDNTKILLQGEDAMQYIDEESNCVKYLINGFEEFKVIIKDYRENSIEGIKNYLETDNPTLFHNTFNTPAWVDIDRESTGNYTVTLRSATSNKYEYYLWIAIGIGSWIPAYDYLILESVPLKENTFAMFSVYQYFNQVVEELYSDPACHVDIS
jgi:hypothetical protein